MKDKIIAAFVVTGILCFMAIWMTRISDGNHWRSWTIIEEWFFDGPAF